MEVGDGGEPMETDSLVILAVSSIAEWWIPGAI